MLRSRLAAAFVICAACAPGPGRTPEPYLPPSGDDPYDAGSSTTPPPPPAIYDSGTSSNTDTGSDDPPPITFLDSGTSTNPPADSGTTTTPPDPVDAGTVSARDAASVPAIPDAGTPWDAGSLPAVDPMIIARLQAALDTQRTDQETLGAGLGLLAPNVGMWTGTAGSILPNGTPLSPSDKFQIGSVTKTFTAVLTLMLAEQGLLQLDAPISTWFPSYPNANTITVRMLLNHTSGLAEYLLDPALNITVAPATHEALLSYAASQPLQFAPGTQHGYSNTNYILLGLIIEAAGGASYVQQLNSRILDPLGLSHTYLNGDEIIPGGYAPGVYINNRNFVLTTEEHGSVAWAAGAMVSTMDDMLHWFLALGAGIVIQPNTMTEMLGNGVQIPGVNPPRYYGLGMMWEESERGVVFFHDGLINDTSCVLAYLPDINLIVIAYTNTYQTNPFLLLTSALTIVAP